MFLGMDIYSWIAAIVIALIVTFLPITLPFKIVLAMVAMACFYFGRKYYHNHKNGGAETPSMSSAESEALASGILKALGGKDNIVKLTEVGARALHIRIACPPLIYPCVFLNFSTSRSTFDLFTRRVIKELEGTEEFSEELLRQYADPDSPKHAAMVEVMRRRIGADTLRFQRLEDLVRAIGLPKEELCTHCWDNSSYL